MHSSGGLGLFWQDTFRHWHLISIDVLVHGHFGKESIWHVSFSGTFQYWTIYFGRVKYFSTSAKMSVPKRPYSFVWCQNFQVPKCPCAKILLCQNVHLPKMSLCKKVLMSKSPCAQKVFQPKPPWRQNVHVPECPRSQKIPLPKCYCDEMSVQKIILAKCQPPILANPKIG